METVKIEKRSPSSIKMNQLSLSSVQATKKKRRGNRKRPRLSCRQRKRREKRAEKDHEAFMHDAKIFLKNWEPRSF